MENDQSLLKIYPVSDEQIENETNHKKFQNNFALKVFKNFKDFYHELKILANLKASKCQIRNIMKLEGITIKSKEIALNSPNTNSNPIL